MLNCNFEAQLIYVGTLCVGLYDFLLPFLVPHMVWFSSLSTDHLDLLQVYFFSSSVTSEAIILPKEMRRRTKGNAKDEKIENEARFPLVLLRISFGRIIASEDIPWVPDSLQKKLIHFPTFCEVLQ